MRHEECRMTLLRGEANPDVDAHLENCGACARLATAMGEVRTHLRDIPPPSAGLTERVLERMTQERTKSARRGGRDPGHGLRSVRTALVLAAALALGATLPGALSLLVAGGGKAVAMVPLTADCGSDPKSAIPKTGPGGGGKLEGRRIVVAGVWAGKERANFREVLDRFEQETGVEVTFAYKTRDIATTLRARAEGGCPPDVALLPQPGLLADLARSGVIEPIDGVAGDLVKKNYAPSWRRLARVEGKLYGVWFKAANKSTFWYDRPLFQEANVRAPATWERLQQVAESLHKRHIRPFSVAGGAGWTLTDWFENVYLRTAGPDRYDKLASGAIPWTDPSVKQALTTLTEILGRRDWIDEKRALRTSYEESVSDVFADRRAGMVYEGGFVASQIADATNAKIPIDAGVFDFPAINGSKPAVVAGGDVAVLFNSDPAAQELIRFLATPEAAEPWAKAGGFVSPNKNLHPDSYPDPTSRRLAQALVNGRTLSFDLSDLQPPAFGARPGQGMWKIFQDYLAHPRDLNATTRRLQKGATAARKCERDVEGSC
jgi:alpha-glucoside transport system substrate-binding protein